MPHHHDPDAITTARLHGAASRHAGWHAPEGEARERAVAELREIATDRPKPRRGAIHQPTAKLRTDLLAQVAGILLGAAPADHPEHHQIAAQLLIDAGADPSEVERWMREGRARAAMVGPAFSRAESALPPRSAMRRDSPP